VIEGVMREIEGCEGGGKRDKARFVQVYAEIRRECDEAI
jgi:hypothetical protein